MNLTKSPISFVIDSESVITGTEFDFVNPGDHNGIDDAPFESADQPRGSSQLGEASSRDNVVETRMTDIHHEDTWGSDRAIPRNDGHAGPSSNARRYILSFNSASSLPGCIITCPVPVLLEPMPP